MRAHLKPTNKSWRVDETYVRVKGEWCYLYRAVDSEGATVEFFLSAFRDRESAQSLFRRAIRHGAPPPRVINTDLAPTYPTATAGLQRSGDLPRRCWHRPVQYLNNIVEIVFTQMTKTGTLSSRVGWNGVSNLHLVIRHKDTVNQEFD